MTEIRAFMRIVESAGIHDGDTFFRMGDDEMRDLRNERSRSTLIYMTPDDFLLMAEHGVDQGKAATVSAVGDEGKQFDSLPSLTFVHDGEGQAEVIGHEGRHRARYLKSLGVRQMPVALHSAGSFPGRGIRWGLQDRSFDRVPVFPKTLKGQDGRGTIAMPHSAIFPLPDDLPAASIGESLSSLACPHRPFAT